MEPIVHAGEKPFLPDCLKKVGGGNQYLCSVPVIVISYRSPECSSPPAADFFPPVVLPLFLRPTSARPGARQVGSHDAGVYRQGMAGASHNLSESIRTLDRRRFLGHPRPTRTNPRRTPCSPPLGTSPLLVPDLCLGTMTFGKQTAEADAHAQLDLALAHGINLYRYRRDVRHCPPGRDLRHHRKPSSGAGWCASPGTASSSPPRWPARPA